MIEKSSSVVASIQVSQLKIDSTYQRSIRRLLVNKIKQEFDDRLAGALVVSKRDNGYYVLDGQHRFVAMRELGVKDAVCLVLFDLTPAEEARMFDYYNTNRTGLSSYDIHRAKVRYEDPDALKISQILAKYGFNLTNYNEKNCIAAVATVYGLFRKLGEVDFDRTIKLLRETWNGLSTSIDKKMLQGMQTVMLKAGKLINDDEFVAKLKPIDPLTIARKAQAISFGYSPSAAYATCIIDHYNSRRKQESRVPNELLLGA
jgi:uncharacterized ParB-like nuclease family protein